MNASRFPVSVSDLRTDWLSMVLNAPVCGFDIEPIGEHTGFAASVYGVRLRRPEDDVIAPSTVVWKTSSDHVPTRRLLNRLGAYRTEVEFYRLLGASVDLAPRCHYADYDSSSGDMCLLLEDLSKTAHSDQIEGCTIKEALTVASTIGRMHGRYCAHRRPLPDWVPAFDNGSGLFQRLHSICWNRLAESPLQPPTELIDVARRIASHVPQIKRRLARQPVTLLHGDLRSDNLFFSETPERPTVKVIDWQAVRSGRGAYDLAYFMAMSLKPDVRRKIQEDLLRVYVSQLDASGCGHYPVEECMEDMRWALLDVVTFIGIIGSTLDFQSARGLELSQTMMCRLWQAIEDTSAMSLLD